MPIISFPYQVLVPSSVNPPYVTTNNYSVSTVGVEAVSLGSNVELVAFNQSTLPLTTVYAILSANATPGDSNNAALLRVNSAYNGVQFAVVYRNRSSSLFTAATANQSPTGQTLTDNGFETVSPNVRRLVNLGYL